MMRSRLLLPMIGLTLLAACDAHTPTRPVTDYERGYRDGASAARVIHGPIAITRASYGTWSRSCDATALVSGQASGKYSFRMTVTNTLCGDPHPGKSKSLDVSYSCGNQGKTASAREHDTLSLRCP